ncbi:hypothetical protein C1A38_00565 [Verrucosispora sp. ts21]|nr:hypothetical protein C1A38_00565 [Verrucosispora sp. ts21]
MTPDIGKAFWEIPGYQLVSADGISVGLYLLGGSLRAGRQTPDESAHPVTAAMPPPLIRGFPLFRQGLHLRHITQQRRTNMTWSRWEPRATVIVDAALHPMKTARTKKLLHCRTDPVGPMPGQANLQAVPHQRVLGENGFALRTEVTELAERP